MTAQEKLREQLLIAGIQEIDLHGVENFSLRKAAAACNVSCATPYHYFKSKKEFVLEILRYINGHWAMIEREVEKAYSEDIPHQIAQICVAYIRFLNGNPNFRSIILQSGTHMEPVQLSEKAESLNRLERRIVLYCSSRGLPEAQAAERAFLVRSVVYGAAFMLDSGIAAEGEKTFATVRRLVLEALM